MSRVLWVRHGQSTWNLENRMQGHASHPPLTKLGGAQATIAAKNVQAYAPTAVHTSPSVRAAGTARIIGAHLGLTPVVNDLLLEKGIDEDWGDVLARARSYLAALDPAETVVAVSHGDFIPVALLDLADLPSDSWTYGALGNGDVATLDASGEPLVIPAD